MVAAADRHGSAIAVEAGTDRLTYFELNSRANQLAWHLIRLGLESGQRVAICLDPGLLTAVAVLGVLKAGCAYVPVSSRDPVGRISWLVEDSGAAVLLTQDSLVHKLAEVAASVVALDGGFSDQPDHNPPRSVRPEQTAYVLYTSGSSGNPKGVMVPHSALAYYLDWHLRHFRQDIGGLDLPLSASMCFAAGVTQFYAPLLLGRTLHIFPHDTVRQPERLFAWYADHPGFALYCVPTLWSELLRFAEARREAGRPVTPPAAVLLSGEAVDAPLVERSVELWPDLGLWNLYGPTEATANGTAGPLRPGRPMSLGRPLAGTAIFLVDEAMREVTPGEIGEICICGEGVATGYVNLPDPTAERFLPNPFAENHGQKLFRTGDLGRHDADGELIFIGRKDFQVKIRGYRIECGEVQAVLAVHPAIRQALVTCHDGGEKQLVAYVTFGPARYATVDEMRAFLAERLPDYMVPGAFVLLDAFPKLANGKIDRARLPPPGRMRPVLAYPFAAPASVSEKQLVRIWEEALGVEGIGADDDFFDLGGNSLKVAAAMARIRETMHAVVSYGDFFAHPTPAGLAALLHIQAEAPPLVPTAAVPFHSCSDNQAGLWLLDQTFPGITAYSMQFSLRFSGALNLDALAVAFDEVTSRHQILRTVIRPEDAAPAMRIGVSGLARLEPVDVDGEDEVACKMATDRDRPFDLARGPLLRATLYRQGADRHRLAVTVHHIVFDGRSISVFCDELVRRYRLACAGKRLLPRTDGLQYHDWAAWRAVQTGGVEEQKALVFWRDALAGAPQVLNFPTDYQRPPVRRFEGAVRTLVVDATRAGQVADFARAEQATPFMVLLATFIVLLHRHCGQDDILVGTPVANRGHSQAETLIGYFANTVVLRGKIEAGDSFRRVLASVRAVTLAALEHQSLPFEKLVNALQVPRNLGHTPLFQVLFAFHERLPHGLVTEGLEFSAREDGNPAAKFDLTLEGSDSDDGLELRLTYNTDLFADAGMERFLDQYRLLLGAMLAEPDRDIATHPLLTETQSRRMVQDWNATVADTPYRQPLHRLFERQATRSPDRLALVDPGLRLTYGELNGRANQLARHLTTHGVVPGVAVGVHLDASAAMIVAILAILKAGGTYVPLDPFYPAERIGYIIEDSAIPVLVTTRRLLDQLNRPGLESVCLDTDWPVIADYPDDDGVSVEVDPESLIYLMYTSGSTGKPKGVMVPHRGASNYVLWMLGRFPLGPDDKVLCKTSINFDISVWEIFLPLIAGAGLVLGSREDIQAPDALARLIRDQGITDIQFVPSALRAFVDANVLAGCTGLKRIFAGGEALALRLQQEVFQVFAGELHNLYGPTEASIYSCHWQCRRDERLHSVPIGGPIDNTEIYILDARMQPVAEGVAGDLHIGGVGVALGYRNKADITAKAFVPDTFSARPGAMLFKTGDQARYWGRGLIEFLGRGDGQVKVRGYRVELGEIEHHLRTHPQVRHAIIIAREDNADDVRLVAYMLYREESGPSAGELRDYLRRKLPDYMVPSHFMVLDSIPLLPNSKANIAALPKPEFKKTPDAELQRNYGSDLERRLAGIWEDVLGTEKFGPEDSFFDVGGHSLLIAKLRLLIEERLATKVSNIDLFQFPTIAGLAQHLSRSSSQPVARIAAEMARRAGMRKRS